MLICVSPGGYKVDGLKPVVKILHTLQNLYPEIQTIAQHSIDFVTTFGASFEKNPFVIYLTALPFSPSSFQSTCLTRNITIKSRQDGWVRKGRRMPCTISPDGESLAILSKDRLSLVSIGSGRPLWECVNSGLMQAAHLTPSEDGKTLLSISFKDGSSAANILLIDVLSGVVAKEVVLEVSHAIDVKDTIGISLSPSQAYITLQIETPGCRAGHLYLYEATGGPPLVGWSIYSLAIRWLSEEHLLAPLGLQGLYIVNAQSQELAALFDLTGLPSSITIGGGFSTSDPLGEIFAVGLHEDFLAVGLRGCIAVWKGPNQLYGGTDRKATILKPDYFHIGGEGVTACCFSPDGKHIALGPGNHTIELWSCTRWIRIATLYGLVDDRIDELAFRQNGKQLVSHSCDGIIQIWDISGIVEGCEHGVEIEEGTLAVGSWFKHGIQLGGFFLREEKPEPFLFDYPFELPEGVEHLNWEIKDSNDEEASV